MKLSIIIPVYNVEAYLSMCLESLVTQDMDKSEYEIILVNDGSTDNSLKIIKEFKEKFSNTIIINQENQGVSNARNNGLARANGKYVWFIDPDDFIEANSIPFIIESLESFNADIMEIGFSPCPEDSIFKDNNNVYRIDGMDKLGAGSSGCIYIIKKTLLTENNIWWNNELSYGEDYLFAFQIKSTKHRNIFSNNVIYNYRQRSSSSMNDKSILNIIRHRDSMLLLAQIYKEYFFNGSYTYEIKNNLNDRISLCIQAALVDCIRYDLPIDEIITDLKQKQLYPYKPLLSNLRISNNFKRTVLNYSTFLFFNEVYVKTLYKIKKIIKMK